MKIIITTGLIIVAIVAGLVLFFVFRGENDIDSTPVNVPVVLDEQVSDVAEEVVGKDMLSEQDTVEYRNDEIEIMFPYPSVWGKLSLESQRDGAYVFNASNTDLIKTIIFHEPAKKIIFVEKHGEYTNKFSKKMVAQEIVKMIDGNGVISTILEIPETSVVIGGNFRSLAVSPNGGYLEVLLGGWEWHETMLFDLESGVNVLNPRKAGFAGKFQGTDFFWLDGDSLMLFANHLNRFGGEGSDTILISDYGNIELRNVFDLTCQEGDEPVFQYKIIDATLKGGSVFFSAEQDCYTDEKGQYKEGMAYYEYDLETKTFSRLP